MHHTVDDRISCGADSDCSALVIGVILRICNGEILSLRKPSGLIRRQVSYLDLLIFRQFSSFTIGHNIQRRV